MTVRRFRFVKPKTGKVVHFHFNRYLAEGTLTACGITLRQGWIWSTGLKSRNMKALPVCKRCVTANE